MEVALKIVGREQRQILRLPLGEAGIVLGRGWNCEAILNDSRVDAQHARLRVGADGELQVLDLDSINGTKLNGHVLNGDPTPLASGSVLTLGRTQVTVFDPDHPVPAARRPSALDSIRDGFSRSGVVLLLTLVCVAIGVGVEYLGYTGKFKTEDFISQLLGILTVGVVWTLFWAAVGKMVRGEAHLMANWCIAMLAAAAGSIGSELSAWVGFNSQSAGVFEFTSSLITFAILVLTLLFALAFNTNIGRRTRLGLALLPAVVLIGINTILPLFDDDKSVNVPPALLISQPPAFKVGSESSADAFLETSGKLFERTAEDAARRVREAEAQ